MKFTKTQKSGLDLTVFGGKIFVKKKIITLSGVNFGALMILYSEIGGHVLTPFLAMSQDNQVDPSVVRRLLHYADWRSADEDESTETVADGR